LRRAWTFNRSKARGLLSRPRCAAELDHRRLAAGEPGATVRRVRRPGDGVLDLYRVKSGDEIVSQLFRGSPIAAAAARPTPGDHPHARPHGQRENQLAPAAIKWFSIPRLFRAENPQKGRLREFFQWNIDVIGSDDVLADAECIFTCVTSSARSA